MGPYGIHTCSPRCVHDLNAVLSWTPSHAASRGQQALLRDLCPQGPTAQLLTDVYTIGSTPGLSVLLWFHFWIELDNWSITQPSSHVALVCRPRPHRHCRRPLSLSTVACYRWRTYVLSKNIDLHRELLVTLPLQTCSTAVDNKPCCEIFDPKDLLRSCSRTSTPSVLLLDYRFYSGFASGLNLTIGASSDQVLTWTTSLTARSMTPSTYCAVAH